LLGLQNTVGGTNTTDERHQSGGLTDVATLLYVGLTRGRPEPSVYLVAHVLKILGGAGGFFAERRRKAISGAAADVP